MNPLILRGWKHIESVAEKMNVELQEKWETSEDKLKTLEEFTAKYGLKRTDTPYPPGFP